MKAWQHKVLSYEIGIAFLLFGSLLSTVAAANSIPIANIDMVASGGSHACSLSNSGTVNSKVRCWGYNGKGGLGVDNTIGHGQPKLVQGLPTNIVTITAGEYHSCALTQNGDVWCWGGNDSGQLGINSITEQHLPVQVNGLSGVTEIDAGTQHTCAINANFETFCWGSNSSGQLGDGTDIDRLVPTAVVSMPAFPNSISAGKESTCASTSQGNLVCWGLNDEGQLGDSTTDNSLVPNGVSGAINGTALSVSIDSGHACAVQTGGSVYCWGYYPLGDGTTTESFVPVQVLGISGAQNVSVGYNHSCATTQSNEAFCWGNNYNGQLGNSSFNDGLTATSVSGLSNVIQISAGENFSCGVLSNGGLFCWGSNSHGQMGDGSSTNYLLPQTVQSAPINGASLALGDDHSCMLSANGSLRCWGSNEYGQIGDDSYLQRLTPRLAIAANIGVTNVSTGENHNCVLAPQAGVSKAFCWGRNYQGELGDGSFDLRLSPTPVSSSASEIASIAAGENHTCLADAVGNVECSGFSSSGQTCQTSSQTIKQFQQCNIALSNALIVSGGGRHSCALTSLNQVWCWGYNIEGELGVGNNTNSSDPVRVSALDGNVITNLALGGEHSCALTNTGAVFCWGRNQQGQLGIDSFSDSNIPVAVVGLAGPVAQLALGGGFSCARLVSGAMQCWGENTKGQLGNGNTSKSKLPIQVFGLSVDVADIGAGSQHACAIRSSGAVQCWGDNFSGQLGNGFAERRAWPASVTVPVLLIFQNSFE